uniref:WRC domain-containing protein n=1 Tax=Opuntia streptacantha TaxID=393608 RepID=A0A7C9D9U1_OPUST
MRLPFAIQLSLSLSLYQAKLIQISPQIFTAFFPVSTFRERMYVGVPPPPDEERCRRRGTPNWRCPQRALPGKSHCLKHYLFYVSRRHRLKSAGERVSAERAAASVEPYRPVIDFDCLAQPVQTVGSGFNDQTALVSAEVMGRFGEVDLWNGEIAPIIEPALGGNDSVALGGQIADGRVFDGLALMGKFAGGDGVVLQNKPKRGRPKGSKTKKKGEESGDVKMRMNVGRIDHHDPSVKSESILDDHDGCHDDDDDDERGCKRRQNLSWLTPTTITTRSVDTAFMSCGDKQHNLSWVMRDKQWSDGDNDDEDFGDQKVNLHDKDLDEGLWCNGIGESPTTRNGATMIKKKRGRPKGSKNKPKIFTNGGEVHDTTAPNVDPAWSWRSLLR